tara:strand:+ start:207 stop:440 length:234 start_codon:yes stop_codon:yes gene_type:complete
MSTDYLMAGLAVLSALCGGVWWLSRLSSNTTQTTRDVNEIKVTTKQISESMIGFQYTVNEHDKRITKLEKEVPKCKK